MCPAILPAIVHHNCGSLGVVANGNPAAILTLLAGKGVGKGGKLGSTGGTLLTQYVLKNYGGLKNPLDEDVRASILRHAGA